MPVGLGSGGISRARLLMAQRAGYLPAGQPLTGDPVQAWRAASKNLAKNARSAGFSSGLSWLQEGVASRRLPPSLARGRPFAPHPAASVLYHASRMAAKRTLASEQFKGYPRQTGI